MAQAGRQDIRTVQALRGLACTLVVAYHAVGSWGGAGQPPRPADAIWPNGAAGVDVFFVISGFVMALAGAGQCGPDDARRLAIRRLHRLLPLYWLMTCAKLVLLAVSGAAEPGAWQVAASLLFIPARDATGIVRPVLGVGWTLQFEVLFYGLFVLAMACRMPARRVLLPVLVPLALAGFFRRPDWPAPLVLANGLVLEFCLGLAVASLCSTSPPADTLSGRLFAAGLFAAGLLLLLTVPQPGPWRFVGWGVPAAMMLAGAVWLEPSAGARLPGWLLATGDVSYATYLLHPFLIPALATVILPRVPNTGGLWLLVALGVGVSTLGGAALHHWVDRRCQRWLAATRRKRASLGSERFTLASLTQP